MYFGHLGTVMLLLEALFFIYRNITLNRKNKFYASSKNRTLLLEMCSRFFFNSLPDTVRSLF